jgi:hypothetical protein
MLEIIPWAALDHGLQPLHELAGALVGDRLRAVRYAVPAGERWPHGHLAERVHEVDMGVDIFTGRATALRLRWEMDGLNEGLGIGLLAGLDGPSTDSAEGIDVSEHADWKPLLGRTVEGVAFATHVPNEGCPDSLWAMRLDLTGSASVTIALGESKGDRIGYQPDALVVMFDGADARAYRIPASALPAWGQPLP